MCVFLGDCMHVRPNLHLPCLPYGPYGSFKEFSESHLMPGLTLFPCLAGSQGGLGYPGAFGTQQILRETIQNPHKTNQNPRCIVFETHI